jgi:glycosyltransferase involved in cell wall biosynthesis
MKIILVANTDWYLFNFRTSLARFLREQDFEVVLVSPTGKFAPQLQNSGFRWIPWQVGRQSLSPWKELTSFIKLVQIYQKEKPDLVHHFTIKPVLYGSLAAQITRVRGIVNAITGLGYVFLSHEAKARWIQRGVRLFYRQIFSRPHCAAIFENDTDRQRFIQDRLVPASQTWLIEGVGVDPEYYSPVPEQEGKPLVILPARMLWDKGVGTLVEAARILYPQQKARVALVGEPDPGNPSNIDAATLESWVREGVVEWWGWQQDMRAVYQASHIVTLPSMGEGIPTALLEAASCARPIVASDTSGCRDVVLHGVNGLLVPRNDPPALAAALEQLVCDPELRGRMGRAGRQMVLERFTNVQINEKTLAVYLHALSG